MATFAGLGTVRSLADDARYYRHDGWHRDAWSHDDRGYWDGDRGYHHYAEYEHHHGYWRTRPDGVRFFINVGD